MASTRSILSAAKAAPAGRPTPAPQGNGPRLGATSPVVQQLDVANGYASAYGNFLPRPPAVFTQGAFGPFSPVLPAPVDTPTESGRPEPRREQYQVGWDLPVGEPGTEGLKLATFGTLRTLADLYSVARACIQLRKSEIRGLTWDIMPTTDAAKANKGSASWFRDFGERRAEAMRFCRRPDPDYFSWNTFIDAALEEVFVFDALSLYVRSKRGKGMKKGLLGSDLDCLNLISGPSIRPLYAIDGSYPRPPAPAYQQYLYGVPRSDFMQLVTGRDIEESGMADSLWGQFRADQLMYLPMVPRRWTPYGFPPVERALIPIMSGLQKQGWALDWFREGTVPAIYMSPGDENMTPNQIRELQDALNAFAGDPAWHHKIIVLPPKSSIMPQRDTQLADQFDEVIMNQVCMAFDVMPMELGISPKVSTTISPGASNQMAKMSQSTSERKATKPLLMYLCDIMNTVIQVICGQDDMEFVFEGLQEEQDQVALTALLVEQVTNGLRSVDEARDELNLPPWGLPETGGPVFLSQTGPVPFDLAVQTALTAATNPAPTTPSPAADDVGGSAEDGAPAEGKPSPTKPGSKPDVTPASQSGDTPGHAAAEGADTEAGQRGHAPSSSAAKPRSGAEAKPEAKPEPKASAANKVVLTVGLAKAVNAELEALTRHLRKGRLISTWQPKNVPPRTLAVISKNLADGMDVTQAVDVARVTTLAYGEGGEAAPKARMAPTWPGWKSDQKLADSYASRIQAALRGALVEPLGSGASADVMSRAVVNALDDVLRDLWREAWSLGSSSAQQVIEYSTIYDAPPDRGNDAGALADYLASQGKQDVATIAGTGLENAVTELTAAGVNRETVMRRLLDLLTGPARAALIARTEVARLVSLGAVARYQAAGVGWVTWECAPTDACVLCLTNADDGPTRLGDTFDGQLATPPQHPDCRCVLVPSEPPGDKAARRVIPLSGEVTWADEAAPEANAAGGGGQSPVRHWGDGTQAVGDPSVTGGTAGTEPPRWPSGDIGTGQAPGGSMPGDANDRGRAPGGTGKADRVKVTPESVDYRATASTSRRCGTCVMFQPPHGCDLVLGHVDADHVCDRWLAPTVTKADTFGAAGLAVIAGDTGRVLMLQRANDEGDPAGGRWEFPGGRPEDDIEDELTTAIREWQEETGCVLPAGQLVGTWASGVYRGFAYRVSAETDVPIFDGRDRVTNPDDPDGDATEALAWWDPAQLTGNPAVRAELLADLGPVLAALRGDAVKGVKDLPPFPRVADPATVRAVMSDNFPPESLGWVDDAHWIGPVRVPLKMIDLSHVESWAAGHQPDAVSQFERRLTDDDPHDDPHPAIMVKTPGDPQLKVVDGHHRVLAARNLKRSPLAYIGIVNRRVGPWDETHSFQRHQGDDPHNG